MSRIDDALKAFERGDKPGQPTHAEIVPLPSRTNEPFKLNQFATETGSAGADTAATNQGADPVETPSRPSLPSRPSRPSSPIDPSDPELDGPGPTRRPAKRVNGSLTAVDVQARLVTGLTNAVSLEQYRRLAAALHDVQLERGLKTVMITSALPDEGKTLTLANLALTLSESYDRRVLIIDADLRWPSIHTLMDIPNGRGLSEALRSPGGELPIVEISPRLGVMTAGRPGPTPLAGLSSPRMAHLLEECAARYDWVLLDTPPVGLMPDAQVLARLTRAVVFVIGAGTTPAATVERAVAELGPECIIGTVLNRVDNHTIPAAGYYSHYSKRER